MILAYEFSGQVCKDDFQKIMVGNNHYFFLLK